MIAKHSTQNLWQTALGFIPAQQPINLGKRFEKLTAYIQKSWSCLVQEPQLFIMRKLARFEVVRAAYQWFGYSRPIDKTASASLFQDLNVQEAAAQIKQDGCFPGLQLPADLMQQILGFAATESCHANRNLDLPFHISDQSKMAARLASSNRPLVLASYMGKHESCPAFQRLVNDPVLLAIAEQYFGKPPRYVSSELIWSFPTSTTLFQQLQAAQVLHCDIDDYSCIKFFFYLTDVDELSGPHIYLRSSHKHKPLRHQILGKRCASIPDQTLIDHYGSENLISLCGPAGYGFVEDIFGFHKGSPPQQHNRLLLQIEFATNTYKTLRSCEW